MLALAGLLLEVMQHPGAPALPAPRDLPEGALGLSSNTRARAGARLR